MSKTELAARLDELTGALDAYKPALRRLQAAFDALEREAVARGVVIVGTIRHDSLVGYVCKSTVVKDAPLADVDISVLKHVAWSAARSLHRWRSVIAPQEYEELLEGTYQELHEKVKSAGLRYFGDDGDDGANGGGKGS